MGSYLGHKKDRQGKPLWMRWVRLMMGLLLSPYSAIQGLSWASDVVRGDRSDAYNPFRWDKIGFNPRGDPSYSPTIPWISKFGEGGGLKSWPQTLPPIWMTSEWRKGHKKRRIGHPREWGLFVNTWDYMIPYGRGVWPGRTEVHGEVQRYTPYMCLFIS